MHVARNKMRFHASVYIVIPRSDATKNPYQHEALGELSMRS